MKITFRGTRTDTRERIEGVGVKSYDDEIVIITEQGEFPIIPTTLRITGKKEILPFEEPTMTQKQVRDLHETIMSAAITYLSQNKIKGVDEISFGADGLETSVELGYWTPATDSSLYVYGYENEEKREIGHNI